METKSRYEVISDLEAQKRTLVRERDGLEEESRVREKVVVELERVKEDITKQKADFEMRQKNTQIDLERDFDNNLLKLKREKEEYEFKLKNTEEDYTRRIADAKEDSTNFKTTKEERKKTIQELIKGVDDSLERFGKLQTNKS